VNPQVRRLFFVLAGLFVALVAMTTYWLWKAPDLEARQGNPTLIVRQLTIERGLIYASDGKTVFARNRKVRKKSLGRTWFVRRYPRRDVAAHPVGYSTIERARAGLEESLNDYLTGSNANLDTILNNTLDKLKGLTRRGNDVVTTINARAQRAAMSALEGKCGAAVALDPQTGKVLVWASQPSYDPNLVEGHFGQIQRISAPCQPAAPLVDRVSQGLFIPGSTFKVVTAAAALDSGAVTPSTTFVDRGYCMEYGKKVLNYADQSGPEVFGSVSFTEALEHSINAVFCDIGKRLGARKIIDKAEDFGFYEEPPVELPSQEIAPSGLYQKGRLYDPKDPNAVDPGRFAFGQERLQVTPLQMALVAAGVANGGEVMKPSLVDHIVAPDGKVIQSTRPARWKEAMKPQTAAELTAMMTAVVESGTGTAAQIPGVQVAGKTGTAETGRQGQNDTWFIAFAPAGGAKVAIAVALSNQSGTGGTTAAPIAKAIIEALLGRNA
jgi:penicillin-binding protein A